MFCNRKLWNFLDLSGKSLSKFGRSLLTDLYSLKWNMPEMGKYTQRVCIALTRCDKIWQFIIFWATFQSPGNNYFANTFLAIFVKVPKSVILLEKSYLGNFYIHLAIFYWSHFTQSFEHRHIFLIWED